MPSLLLVPSPLLGPSTWIKLAAAARRTFERVEVADIRGAIGAGPEMWPHMVRLAKEAARPLRGEITVVGHSGAGAILPGVGAALGTDLDRLVFVDAVIPPRSGGHRYPDAIRELVASMAEDGLLPPWLDWWPPATVADLVPAGDDLQMLRSDQPRVPLRWFDEVVPVPAGWSESACSYVRLSPAYDTELGKAVDWGWATASLDSTHLGMISDPESVLEAILSTGR
jgi:hypothetical protein